MPWQSLMSRVIFQTIIILIKRDVVKVKDRASVHGYDCVVGTLSLTSFAIPATSRRVVCQFRRHLRPSLPRRRP